jgi:bifunctional DNA-binding transcriptional regulator/antitoxin component of YhaV-PrlF toxin-antitoxin module
MSYTTKTTLTILKIATLSEKGAIHLPKKAREHLGIPPGKPATLEVYVGIEENGDKIVILKLLRIEEGEKNVSESRV